MKQEVKWPQITLILVVSSDQSLAEQLTQVLGKPDWQITIAPSLGESQRCLARARYHLVLLDLPAAQPQDHLDLIKTISFLAPPPQIIALVEENDFELAVAALKSGASNFIPKPLNWEVLPRLIDLTLAQKS